MACNLEHSSTIEPTFPYTESKSVSMGPRMMTGKTRPAKKETAKGRENVNKQ